MPRQIAVIGGGPAGLYAVERLNKVDPAARIDVFDRLPVPFGLIRYGVAPDHQATKAVTRVLMRGLEKPTVRFIGGVEICRHVSLDGLRAAYDAVLVATGCGKDRRLGIPGEDLPGVLTASDFVAWYNDLPDHGVKPPAVPVRDVVVIGAGNVALDVARLLAKGPEELTGSDLAPATSAHLAAWPLRQIAIVARRGAVETKFTTVELEELGRLSRAQPCIDPAVLPKGDADETPVVKILRGFAGQVRDARPIPISFRFGLVPSEIQEDGHVRNVLFQTGEQLSADLVVTCIGSLSAGLSGLPCTGGVIANRAGVVADGLYVVGWAGKGASGTIPASRGDAHRVADLALASAVDGGRPGWEAIASEAEAAGARIFSLDDWKKIDAAERARAPAGRVRHKFGRVADMDEARRA